MPGATTAVRELIPTRRELTVEELAYVQTATLTEAQQAAYETRLRGMTEEQLNAERRQVQARYHLFQYGPRGRGGYRDHPDFWRSDAVNREIQRRHQSRLQARDSIAGAAIGALLGAGVGKLAGRRVGTSAAFGAAAGAVAPRVSETARGVTRMAQMAVGFARMVGRGGSMRY